MTEGKKFTLIFSDEERAMLDDLAAADGRSAANWIRNTIRREHGKLANDARKKASRGKR